MRRTFFDLALKPLGITRSQWWALGNISRHAEEGMVQTELARVLEIGKVSVGGLIDRLEDAGLVFRKTEKADRRVKRIFITEKGYLMLDQIAVVGEQLDERLYKNVDASELEAAAHVVMQLKENVREALADVRDGALVIGEGIALEKAAARSD